MTQLTKTTRRAFLLPLIIGGGIFATLAVIFGRFFASSAFVQRMTERCVSLLGSFTRPDQLPMILLGSVLLIMSIMFFSSLIRQLYATHRFLKALRVTTTQEKLPAHTVVVESERPLCFVAGFFRPKIFIANSVFALLTKEELKAVLEHEKCHILRRDPLRMAVLKALRHAFFFLPIFRAFEERFVQLKELAADALALGSTSRAPLASALYKLALPRVQGANLSLFADRTFLEIRIEFLGGQTYQPLPIALSKILTSGIMIVILFTSLVPLSRAESVQALPCDDEQMIVHPLNDSSSSVLTNYLLQ